VSKKLRWAGLVGIVVGLFIASSAEDHAVGFMGGLIVVVSSVWWLAGAEFFDKD
jgi:hypothetical protein